MTKTYDGRFIIKRTYVYDYVVDAESEKQAEERADDMHFFGSPFCDKNLIDEETTDWETVINAR